MGKKACEIGLPFSSVWPLEAFCASVLQISGDCPRVVKSVHKVGLKKGRRPGMEGQAYNPSTLGGRGEPWFKTRRKNKRTKNVVRMSTVCGGLHVGVLYTRVKGCISNTVGDFIKCIIYMS
jgi:hypothetical protein